MAETVTKLPIKTADKAREHATAVAQKSGDWHPMESLRREIDKVFETFDRSFWRGPLSRSPFSRSVFDVEPFFRHEINRGLSPAVDIVEREKEYEIEAEIPGMDERNLDITLANGTLTIRGEKSEDKEEKKKNYYLSERHYGSFQRAFRVPENVDPEKIEAKFAKGVLKVTLPKSAESLQKEKKISIKAS